MAEFEIETESTADRLALFTAILDGMSLEEQTVAIASLGLVLQTAPADATAGRLLLVGASATTLSASPALRAAYGGTANAITLTTGASLASLTPGFALRFRAAAENTGGFTIDVDGIGAVTAKTVSGAALPSGYIRTDVDTFAYYDGTDWIVNREIERDSNASGAYTRWADGTQICTHKLAAASTGWQTWTLPAAFIDTAARPSGMAAPGLAPRSLSVGVVTTTTLDFACFITNTAAQSAANCSLTAAGHWY